MSRLAVDWLTWSLGATAFIGLALAVAGLTLAVRNGLRIRSRRGGSSRPTRSERA